MIGDVSYGDGDFSLFSDSGIALFAFDEMSHRATSMRCAFHFGILLFSIR